MSEPRRPSGRPGCLVCPRSTVGTGLSGRRIAAMAVYQSTRFMLLYPDPCGSWLASDSGLADDLFLQVYISIAAVTAA